jgi:hypothetical protein
MGGPDVLATFRTPEAPEGKRKAGAWKKPSGEAQIPL